MSTTPEDNELTNRQRGIYALPNLFTVAGMFAGFYAIVAAMLHHYVPAVWALYIAMIMDNLDGRVARLINAQSEFGAQLDSMSDMLCFGVAPALVVYNWSLSALYHTGWGKVGWLSAFIYVACVGLRLAKFNSQDHENPEAKRYFFGLPCPLAAAFVAGFVWLGTVYHLSGIILAVVSAIMMIILALLMVSNIRYRSFKDIDLKGNVRFTAIIVMVLVLAAIALFPPYVLFLLALLYVLSGLVAGLGRVGKRRAK